jgi:hypothetical protein
MLSYHFRSGEASYYRAPVRATHLMSITSQDPRRRREGAVSNSGRQAIRFPLEGMDEHQATKKNMGQENAVFLGGDPRFRRRKAECMQHPNRENFEKRQWKAEILFSHVAQKPLLQTI